MLSTFGLIALLGSAVAAQNSTLPLAVVTQVVSSYVTYCPEATQLVQGNKTYTVTSATTLTITNCPCTITTHATPYTVETTAIVDRYETYCPEATTIVAKNQTYTATPGQTITVTNGPLPVTTTLTLTPGVPATEVKLISSSLLSTLVYTPGPSAAVAPSPEKPEVQPPKPTVVPFTGAAARNEILGLFNLW